MLIKSVTFFKPGFELGIETVIYIQAEILNVYQRLKTESKLDTDIGAATYTLNLFRSIRNFAAVDIL